MWLMCKGAGSASERQDHGFDRRDTLWRRGSYLHYRSRWFGGSGDGKIAFRRREVEVEGHNSGFSGGQLLNRLSVVAGVGVGGVLGGDLQGEVHVRQIFVAHVLHGQVEPLVGKRREGRQLSLVQVQPQSGPRFVGSRIGWQV